MAKEKTSSLLLMLISCVLVYNTTAGGREFFFWYTGMINFQLVTSFACLALAFSIRLKKAVDKKAVFFSLVFGVLFGFLGSGGALLVTSFNCSCLLVMLFLNIKEFLRKKYIIAPFISAFAGALLNACAPGNFMRIEQTAEGISYGITDALRDTFLCWQERGKGMLDNSFLLILLVMAFGLCMLVEIKVVEGGISTPQMLLMFPAVFLIQYFTAFPVILGYHGSGLSNDRTAHTYELLAKLALLFLIVCLAQWWRENIGKKAYIPLVAVLVVVIMGTGNLAEDAAQGMSYRVAAELRDGTIQEVYEVRLYVLGQLEQSEKGADVQIKAPSIPATNTMYGMGLTNDPESFVNRSAAGYWELNSVVVEYGG